MKVIAHEPQLWFLMNDNGKLFFEVSCEHSAVSYSVLIELNPEEESHYENEGSVYLNRLAYDINYSAPGVRGSASIYKNRNVSSQRNHEVMAAVIEWRTEQKI